jgi:hypothetical protein
VVKVGRRIYLEGTSLPGKDTAQLEHGCQAGKTVI